MRKMHNNPDLNLNGIPIKEYKYFGLIFDSKLSFIPHMKALKTKCLKALNILNVMSNTHCGADCTTLLHLYRALVCSKLDYGSIIYGYTRIMNEATHCQCWLEHRHYVWLASSDLTMLKHIGHQWPWIQIGLFRINIWISQSYSYFYCRIEMLTMSQLLLSLCVFYN